LRQGAIDVRDVNRIDTSKFYVIAVISNPVRYWSRPELYKEFEKHVLASGAQLITVEAAFGQRPFVVTQADNKYHLQFRTYDELWHKENMINLAIQRLNRIDPMWDKVAWVDADIRFMREDWVHETAQQLEHYMVVQMFSEAVDLTPNFEIHQRQKGFVWCWHQNDFQPEAAGLVSSYQPYGKKGAKYYWHPGFAWAYRREALYGLGGHAGGPLIDYPCIIGAGDHHMALGLIGEADKSYPKDIHKNYVKAIEEWQSSALKVIKKDIGYVAGTIGANWHGNKADRRYWGRWDIMKKCDFDPETDIRRDDQGLFTLVVDPGNDRQRLMRDLLRDYFRSRKEDSVDVLEKSDGSVRLKTW
jgi:hypothetical protein